MPQLSAPPTLAAPAAYTQLSEILKEVETIGSIGSLLGWDQETYMPEHAAAHRSDQQSFISALAHERGTSTRIGDLIAQCEAHEDIKADASSALARSVREMRRDYDLKTKLPTALVAELAKVGSQAQEVWKQARAKNDFPMFAPWLERMMNLSRQKAECYGVPRGGEIYDALLDEYEPGATAREIESIFTPLAERLSTLIQSLTAAGKHPSDACLKIKLPIPAQSELGHQALKAIGFNFHAGRLDTTAHPFCSGMAPGDTRLTTRYRETAWPDSFYGVLHEGGHGLYEQGLPKEGAAFGTPLSHAISLGIHESQSRMWENFVGRSRAFWVWFLPHLQSAANGQLQAFSVDDIYRAVNTAKPSLIRVESDEATYNLHIMIRFELERAMIAGTIKIKDLPGEWNRLYKQYLGVTVPDDARGCMQDVHWSFGLIGYFPTYTLGNLYAAQLWETILAEIPTLQEQMARGEFGALKTWLNQNIHAHGRRYRAGELCRMLTGKPLSADPLLRHLESRLRPVYA